MGKIFINRNRQSLGQFTEQEVADGLKSGRFLPDDLAWREPMDSWQPLSTFADLPPPREGESLPEDSTPPGLPPSSIKPAWEGANRFFSAIFETVRQIFTEPVETFRNMPTDAGYAKPLKFYVLLGWVTGAIAIIYQVAAALINPAVFLPEEFKNLSPGILASIYLGIIFVLPILLIIGVFLSAALVHFALMVTGGAQKSFQATFRVVAYVAAATSVLQLIPLCGGYLYPLANIIYCIIGLKEAHRTDLWRSLVAVLILFFLCCGLIFATVLFSAGLAGVAAGVAK